jgi:non-specific serine/threonine protein kinase
VRDREVQAVRWLDAEDATLSAAVSWTLEHDPAGALRLATALAPWWRLRGRMIEGYQRLTLAVQRSDPGGGPRARAQLWLGNLAQLASPADGLAHYNAAYEPGDARQSADALAARSIWKLNYGQLAEAADDARRALALAREAGYAGGEAQALTVLCFSAHYTGAGAAALDWARQAEESLGAEVPDWLGRWCRVALAIALTESGELSAARRVFGDSVARSREVGDLAGLTNLLMAWAQLERLSGDQESAWAYLREAVEIAGRIGDHVGLHNCVEACGDLCATTGRWAEAVTLWAAYAADAARTGLPGPTIAAEEDHARRAALALAAGQARDAAERGAQMTLAAAGEFVTMLTAPEGTSVPRTAGELTKRERELVTLVAQGHTNTEIAAHLSISVRTVTSHLDRIRDKTGYRRRADLTRLALSKDLA